MDFSEQIIFPSEKKNTHRKMCLFVFKFRVCLISYNSTVSAQQSQKGDMSFHYLDYGQSITRLTGTTRLYWHHLFHFYYAACSVVFSHRMLAEGIH